MYYSSGNYEAFARPKKPEGVDNKSAYIVGSGLAALSAACYLVRDGQMKGEHIHVLEKGNLPGGACDGLQVEFQFHGDDADEVRQGVADKHERLVNHLCGQIDLLRDELAVEIVVIDGILAGFVGDFQRVQVTQHVCLDGFCHKIASFYLYGEEAPSHRVS